MDNAARNETPTRRMEILDAAASLFAEKGYDRTPVKEIAERAGIAPGTIYIYFDTKGDLLIGLMRRLSQVESLNLELKEALDQDPREFLLEIARHRMELIKQNQQVLRAILPEMLVSPELRKRFYHQFAEPLASLLEHYVRARIELGDIQHIDVPLAVRSMQAMFIGLLVLVVLGDETVDSRWDELPETIVGLVFDGLGPVRGE